MDEKQKIPSSGTWSTFAEQQFLRDIPTLMAERTDRVVTLEAVVAAYQSYHDSMDHRKNWGTIDRRLVRRQVQRLLKKYRADLRRLRPA
tara:strand:- start:645 stop:911 length:267 start_codon:yes stop_codon:yes gene_type:complete